MILAFIEHDRGTLQKASLEILTLGRQLVEQANTSLEVVLIGENSRLIVEELKAYGIAKVHLVIHERLTDFVPEAWAQSLVQLLDIVKPEALIALGSDLGHEVMAHVAARMDLPLAANCTEVQQGGSYQVTRVRWGGSLFEEAILTAETKLLTIMPHSFEVQEAPINGEISINEITLELEDKL